MDKEYILETPYRNPDKDAVYKVQDVEEFYTLFNSLTKGFRSDGNLNTIFEQER